MSTDTSATSPLEDRLDRLKELIPEAFRDGQLDRDALLAAVGSADAKPAQGYNLTWPGKEDAIELLRQHEHGALVPVDGLAPLDVVPRHVIVRSDNLRALRCMYRAYLDQVDLCYIDPPYNTGKDRVYADDFADSRSGYLRASGQADSDTGARLVANPLTNGRFHSRWLSMLYPRLFLAHKLLAADGVMIVSIDDNEVHNLRHLLDEIFGEQNFLAQLVWDKTRKNDAKLFSVGHEYLLVYARSKQELRDRGVVWRRAHPGAAALWDQYEQLRIKLGDDDKAVEAELRSWSRALPASHPSRKLARYKRVDRHGPWRDRDISWPGGDGPRYDVLDPETGKPVPVPEAGWRFADPAEMQRQIDLGLIEFRDDKTKPPMRKAHLRPVLEELQEDEEDTSEGGSDDADADVGMQVMGSYLHAQAQVAVKHLRALFDGKKVFDNPKDHTVLAEVFGYVLQDKPAPLVLDFFAGSGATAEAVLERNATAERDWRFALVQLPEPTPERSTARRAGYEDISAITIERVRRAAARLSVDLADEPVRLLEYRAGEQEQRPPEDTGDLESQLEMIAGEVKSPTNSELQRLIWLHAQRDGIALDASVSRNTLDDADVWVIDDRHTERRIVAWLGSSIPDGLLDLLDLHASDHLLVLAAAISDQSLANLAAGCRVDTLP